MSVSAPATITALAQAQSLGTATFKPDYSLAPGGHSLADAAEAAPVLGSLGRIAGAAGTVLRLGAIKAVVGWGGGRGFAVRYGRDSLLYEAWQGVSSWEEVDAELRAVAASRKVTDGGLPLFPTASEWTDLMKEQKVVDWFAQRTSSSSAWAETVKGVVLNRKGVGQACLSMFQMNVILNAQQFPKGRLAVTFDTGRLWLWVNSRGDHLVMATAKTANAVPLLAVAHLGECFYFRE